ncbi:MAG TPA: MFS transporter [Mycobacteriales bacterium]|nr:MFS transporter [Mycobacteriales bacterium]
MPAARPHRWLILGIGLAAQTATSAYLYGLPMLLPQIRQTGGLSLASAGTLVAAPSIGLLATLILWGAVADRRGERVVMALGLGLGGVFLLGAALVDGFGPQFALLVLAGAGGGSVNAASGRVVLGWFAADERGMAMGVRQTAQPLGVALAALVFPPVAAGWGVRGALVVSALACLVVSGLIMAFVVDPPRAARVPGHRPCSPYASSALWRVHGSGALLVVPQLAISAFALEFLVTQRDWTPAAAGRLLFAVQVAGALGRLVVGVWSDRVASRLRPMRTIAVAAALAMLAVGLGAAAGSVLAVAAIGVATVVTVADNGLGFTAVAELAGSEWAGRALGAQNTAQNITAVLTPPLLAALIAGSGFGVGFAVVSAFPVLAIVTIPVGAEARHWAATTGDARPGSGADRVHAAVDMHN